MFKLFGNKAATIKEYLKKGGIIIDVRSPEEYADGHIKQSVNIPLDLLESNIQKLDKSKPIITCCAAGMRSNSAKNILKDHGFTEVVSGGGWKSLQKYES